MISRHGLISLVGAALVLPATAQAHAGHDLAGHLATHPLVLGLIHPLSGIDHLAAMVMAGLWAGMLGKQARWAVPLAFVAAMLAGLGYGLAAGSSVIGAEWGIVLSILALGVALALQLRPSLTMASVTTALFGFFHGVMHGAEAPGAGLSSFLIGLLVSTTALHAAGVVVAGKTHARWIRTFGTVGAGLGVMLMLG